MKSSNTTTYICNICRKHKTTRPDSERPQAPSRPCRSYKKIPTPKNKTCAPYQRHLSGTGRFSCQSRCGVMYKESMGFSMHKYWPQCPPSSSAIAFTTRRDTIYPTFSVTARSRGWFGLAIEPARVTLKPPAGGGEVDSMTGQVRKVKRKLLSGF